MPARRHPDHRLLAALLVLLGLFAVGYVFGAAWLQARGHGHLRWYDLVVPRMLDVVIVSWLALVGSSVGSFLNVVAWRLPQGRSVQGRSYCPRCHAQLRARDNFPVFGWLALRGRCRTCRLPISPRYPLVEALVGLTITAIGVAELYRLALPYRDLPPFRGPLSAPLVDFELLVTGLYHIVAVSVAWAYGLIRFDGHALPSRLVAWGTALTILPMLVYPPLMVVPWQVSVEPTWRGAGLYLDAVIRVITGLAAGAVFARSLARGFCPAADLKLDPLGRGTARLVDLIVLTILPGVVVGWQALPAVLIVASLLAKGLETSGSRFVAATLGADALGRFAVALPPALALQISCWRLLHQAPWWPSVGSEPWVILAAAAVVLMIPLWLRERPGPAEGEARSWADSD